MKVKSNLQKFLEKAYIISIEKGFQKQKLEFNFKKEVNMV